MSDKKDAVELPEFHDPLYSPPRASILNTPSTPILGPKTAVVTKKAPPPVQTEEPEPTPEPVAQAGPGIELPDYEYEVQTQEKEDPFKDTFVGASAMAFICAGQGAGKLGSAMYDIGYKKFCCVNSTAQDFLGLTIPNTLVIGNNRGGAGKDPEQGRLAAKESQEEILNLISRSWGEEVDIGFVVISGGGGTGSGSLPVLVDIVKDYFKSVGVERAQARKIGIILTLPKKSEGSKVQSNAHLALTQACAMVASGKVASLIIMDNNKISELYKGMPIKNFWAVANSTFASQMLTFNMLAAMDSAYQTFDRSEYKATLQNGILTFGSSKVDRWKGQEDLGNAIRSNLKNSLLSDGFDLSTATMAAAIIVAHDDVLKDLPMENADWGFMSLARALGNPTIVMHTGIYEGRAPGMRVFTMVSGLQPPQKRIDELKSLGNC